MSGGGGDLAPGRVGPGCSGVGAAVVPRAPCAGSMETQTTAPVASALVAARVTKVESFTRASSTGVERMVRRIGL
jgi:hypothetical protein